MNEPEQTQSSHLTLPELICFAGREYECVLDPMLGYIPLAANTPNTICNERITDQIFLTFKRKPIPQNKRSNALVVYCSTRKIKPDWDT